MNVQPPVESAGLGRAIYSSVADSQPADLLRLHLATRGLRIDGGVLRAFLCVDAISCCADELKRTPSAPEYERWRLGRDRSDEWPSASFIIAAFRNWAPALKAAGLRLGPTDAVRRISPRLGPYTRPELLAGLRAYLIEIGSSEALQADYFSWARRQMSADPRVARLCVHPQPFIREFGSWRTAVATASKGCRSEAASG